LLILDEPVNGLDPNGIVEIREMLIRLNREEGKTIFVSSHLLNEIEKTCTHIGIIHHGKLRYQGTLDDMKQAAYASGEVIFRVADTEQWMPVIREHYNSARQQAQDEVLFSFKQPKDVVAINNHLVNLQVPVTGIQIRGGLEEWFMQIIQKDAKQTA
jgi:ABC-2 type transport system ATP-binding protein